MKWPEFKDWAMLGLLTAGVGIFWDLNKGVERLNVTMAVITEKVINTEKVIDRHDTRLNALEKN